MARPHRIPGEAAGHVVRARVTSAELAALEVRAEASGRNMSDLVRACLGLATGPAKPAPAPRRGDVVEAVAAPLPSPALQPAPAALEAPPLPAVEVPPAPAPRPRFGGGAGLGRIAQTAQTVQGGPAGVQLELAAPVPVATPAALTPSNTPPAAAEPRLERPLVAPAAAPPAAAERFACVIVGELELPGFDADGNPRSSWKGGRGFFSQSALDAAPPGKVKRLEPATVRRIPG